MKRKGEFEEDSAPKKRKLEGEEETQPVFAENEGKEMEEEELAAVEVPLTTTQIMEDPEDDLLDLDMEIEETADAAPETAEAEQSIGETAEAEQSVGETEAEQSVGETAEVEVEQSVEVKETPETPEVAQESVEEAQETVEQMEVVEKAEDPPAEQPVESEDAQSAPHPVQAEDVINICWTVRKNIEMDSLVQSNNDIIDDIVKVDEELEFEDDLELFPERMEGGNVSQYKNLFWAQDWTQWVGMTTRADGTKLFAFDHDEAECAKKLNQRAQENGVAHPNPDLGTSPLQNNPDWQTTAFKQVFFHPTSSYYCAVYMGIQASSQTSAKHVAMRLNSRCKAKDVVLANPDAGFEFENTEYTSVFYVTSDTGNKEWVGQVKKDDGSLVCSKSDVNAKDAAMELNEACREAQIPEPNSFSENQPPPLSNINNSDRDLQDSMYSNVFWNPNASVFVGLMHVSGETIEVTAVDAEECAKKLNYECNKRGANLPNPDCGLATESDVPRPSNIASNPNASSAVSPTSPQPLPTQSVAPANPKASAARSLLDRLLGKTGNTQKAESPPPFNSQAYYENPLGADYEDPATIPTKQEAFTFPHPSAGYRYGGQYPQNDFYLPPYRQSRIRDHPPIMGSMGRVDVWGHPYKKKRRQNRKKTRMHDPNAPRKKSRFKGVYWETRDQKWRARVYCNGKRLSGGSYVNEREAALAVNRLCVQLGMGPKNPELDAIKLADEDVFLKADALYGGAPRSRNRRIRTNPPLQAGAMGVNYAQPNIFVKSEPQDLYGGVDALDSVNSGWH